MKRDAERAARLAGAAGGRRRRAGLQVFSSLTGEVELVAQIHQALGADRFDQLYAAGSRLKREEAVAAARDTRHANAQTS